MNKFTKIIRNILIALIVIVVLVGGLGTYYAKSYIPKTAAPKSFPQIEGEIKLAELEDAVDIYRDEMGIAHIYATNVHDLFFAQGYVHAQERFWQMDFWRHIGSGRLSEMFGEGQLETDMFLRTLGWRQTAALEYSQLNPEATLILDSYAEGVNAYLQNRDPVDISLEYLILTSVLNPDYEIEPWIPIHSLTWGKAMAWDLRGNIEEEIERAILLKNLSPEQVSELFPIYPEDHPVIVSELGEEVTKQEKKYSKTTSFDFAQHQVSIPALEQVSGQIELLDDYLGPAGSGIGSNSWALSGELTSTGTPILANDPHLSIQMPSIWYQVNLHCVPKNSDCPFDVGGFSFAGVPGVIIGHNDKIAWGLTNTGPDVMDLFIEKVNPENPNQYEVNGEWVDFETRTESIQVAGSDPSELTVRTSRHGPVLTEVYGLIKDQVDLEEDPEALPFKEKAGVDLPEHYVITLTWTALNPSTPFEAIWGFNRAQNWEDFREAARNFHVPAQNLLYADVEGNIGYQMPGDIPLRANGDGTIPVPGWTGEYNWTGFIAFEDLPYSFNPPSGYIITANNQVHPRDYPYLITKDFNYGIRAQRIVDMIQNTSGKFDIDDIKSMQGDSINLNAETLVPILLSVELDPELASARDQTLGSWDYQNRADSLSAAVFEWFWWNLLMETFSDDLPEEYWPEGGSRYTEVMRNLSTQPDSQWWDDKETPETETRDDLFASAFENTLSQMSKEHGKDSAKWPTWGELHAATFRNGTLGESGIGPIEAMFNRGPYITGGGEDIVNATGWTVGESFEVDWLPSMRMIVDLGNLGNSLTVHTTGQSGHAYHLHYIDMAPQWAAVKYYPMLWNEQSVISNSENHLRLTP